MILKRAWPTALQRGQTDRELLEKLFPPGAVFVAVTAPRFMDHILLDC